MAFFERQFLGPLYNGIRRQIRDEAEQMAAATRGTFNAVWIVLHF